MEERVAPRAAESYPSRTRHLERVVRMMVVVVPLAAIGWAGWLAWGGSLHWHDLLVLAITYLCHRGGHHGRLSPSVHPPQLQDHAHAAGAVRRAGRDGGRGLGDRMGLDPPQAPLLLRPPGDPHSPHAEQGAGWRGALQGLAHAHLGWMFRGKDMANPGRYATDLLADRDLRFISRTFPLWVAAGLALPFGLGVALTGSLVGGLTGLLWGGAVRVFLLHHATFSINSLCHFFGGRPFATGDESRNLAWLAPRAWERPGTTTTTPSRPPPVTVSDAGSSIPPPG